MKHAPVMLVTKIEKPLRVSRLFQLWSRWRWCVWPHFRCWCSLWV